MLLRTGIRVVSSLRVVLANAMLTGLLAGQAAGQSLVNQHVSSAGVQGDGPVTSDHPAISDNDRWVVFASGAANLVAGDTNSTSDVFVRDSVAATTVLLSSDSAGGPSNGDNRRPSMSAGGRYVCWQSTASDLVAGASGMQVYRRDRDTDADGIFDEPGATSTICVSVGPGGAAGNGSSHCYVRAISDDGDRITFESDATDLVAGDTNAALDCFVRIVSSGTTLRVSVSTTGVQGNATSSTPSISGNGLVVAFPSFASNLVAADTNGFSDVFARNVAAVTTTRVSVSTSGTQATDMSSAPTLSDDGNRITFACSAAGLVAGDGNGAKDVFLRDVAAGTTVRVSLADDDSEAMGISDAGVISGDGLFVSFRSNAANLVAGDTNGFPDVFVRDLTAGATALASRPMSLSPANGSSGIAGISNDGSHVAFGSGATNLVAGDINGYADIFLRAEPFLGPSGPPAGWRAVRLHPAGATESWAYAPSATSQGGFAEYGTDHAGIWGGGAPTWVDLNPAGAAFSRVFAMSAAQQAGYADFAGLGTHAGVWGGSAGSWTDLHPPSATASYAHATTGTAQAGYAEVAGAFHASLWSGTAASWSDLHPAGATASYAWGITPGEQVGGAMIGGVFHASHWTGTAASWIDLNPAGAGYSLCYFTAGGEQSGYASIAGAEHAGTWTGTAASWSDLHPPGATASRAYSTTGTVQAGAADYGSGFQAGLWTAGPSSFENLHLLLPASYTSSTVRAIVDAADGMYATGWAFNSALGRDEAVLWTNAPPPVVVATPDDLPVTFSVSGPVDPNTEGIRYSRGTSPTTQIPLQPGNEIGAMIRGMVPQATGIATVFPGDVLDYDAALAPSEAVLFQSPPLAPDTPPPPASPPDSTNNQILAATAMGLNAGGFVPPSGWSLVMPVRDNVDAISFGEDYFPPVSLGFAPDGLPLPPFAMGEIMPLAVPWGGRIPPLSLYSEPIVTADAPGIRFRMSVDPWADGMFGSAVLSEAGDAAGDVFGTPDLSRMGGMTVGGGTNSLIEDNPMLALAPLVPPMTPTEDDIDALEVGRENSSSWLPLGVPLRGGNLHARVGEAGPIDLGAPGASVHEPLNIAPVFFSVSRNSPGEPFSAVRSQFMADGGNAADLFVAVEEVDGMPGTGFNLLFADEAELGLLAIESTGPAYPDMTDDLDGLILYVCPEYRDDVAEAILQILGIAPGFGPGGFDPWGPHSAGGDALTGGGMTFSIMKYLKMYGIAPDSGCVRVGFSLTTDSVGLLYTGADWEAGPVAPMGGVSSVAGDIFYAEIDGEGFNSNYLWYEAEDLGLEGGTWVNGMTTDPAALSDNVDGLDSLEPEILGTGAPEIENSSHGFALERPYPSPFPARGEGATIAYSLPAATRVKVTVHDLAGRRVATLDEGVRAAGRHVTQWDGEDNGGQRVASGVYFIRVEGGEEVRSGKIVVITR